MGRYFEIFTKSQSSLFSFTHACIFINPDLNRKNKELIIGVSGIIRCRNESWFHSFVSSVSVSRVALGLALGRRSWRASGYEVREARAGTGEDRMEFTWVCHRLQVGLRSVLQKRPVSFTMELHTHLARHQWDWGQRSSGCSYLRRQDKYHCRVGCNSILFLQLTF